MFKYIPLLIDTKHIKTLIFSQVDVFCQEGSLCDGGGAFSFRAFWTKIYSHNDTTTNDITNTNI